MPNTKLTLEKLSTRFKKIQSVEILTNLVTLPVAERPLNTPRQYIEK